MKNNSYIGRKYARMDALKRLSVSTGILSRTASDANSFFYADKKKWEALLQACDRPAYSVKYLDELGEKISGAIVGGIKKAYSTVSEATGEFINPEDSYSNKTAKLSGITTYYNITKQSEVKKADYKPGLFGKSLMGLTVISDLIFFGKNLYEAWENGKTVLYSLPLQKWGIDRDYVVIPTPSTIKKTGSDLKKLIEQNKNSPENLAELLDIAKVLKAYSSDFVSSITNAILFFLDVVDIAVSLGTAMVMKPLTGLTNFLLAIPVIAYEIGNDEICEESYGGAVSLIKKICQDHLSIDDNNGKVITFEDLEKFLERSTLRGVKTLVD
jgi:hypothetical protein